MGGAVYRFGLDEKGRRRIYEYLGVYTGLAHAHEDYYYVNSSRVRTTIARLGKF